jgi:alkanesulfonate monooxygenase SsuD/methylene tetrahydromethanopterin reductase-like flavin-dependent oxidoreductase (luciferase family)
MTAPRLGVAFAPKGSPTGLRRIADAIEDAGLDLVGVADHPYDDDEHDAFVVIAGLLAHTTHVRAFTDVACLPLRSPASLVNATTTLNALFGDRFDLGLGAGGDQDAISAAGGPRLEPPEARHWLEIAVHRIYDRAPLATIGIGAIRPRMLELTGRLADQWIAPLHTYLPGGTDEAQAHVDAGARSAGRDPRDVRRIAQVKGLVIDEVEREAFDGPIRTTPDRWAAIVERLTTDGRFDDVVFWPERDVAAQIERFGAVTHATVTRQLTGV